LWLAVGTVFAAAVLVWVVGQVAAVLFGAHHWLPVSLAQVAQVPFHLAKHPGDPKLAWPTRVRGMLPARSACMPPWSWCGTYPAARKVARTLAEAADVSGLREQDANYWTLLGAKLLGVLLYAAARSDRTMSDVTRPALDPHLELLFEWGGRGLCYCGSSVRGCCTRESGRWRPRPYADQGAGGAAGWWRSA
jgi:hypothetical protein